jgi:tetratricopeptide (TPR) repeat protein
MLAGRLPFRGDHPMAMTRSILHDVPESLSSLRDDVPPALDAVIVRALAKDAGDRFPSAAEFLAALGAADPSDAVALARPDATPAEGPAGQPGRASDTSSGSRRVLTLAGAVALLLVSVGTVVARARLDRAPTATTAVGENVHDVIAVLPFTVRGAPDLQYLAEGLVDLVSGKLDGAGSLRTIDPRAIVGRVRERKLDNLDPARGGELARSLGAGRFVLGQVVGVSPRLSLTARLYESDGSAAEPVMSIEGSVDSAFVLVDRLVTELLASSLSGANARVQRSAAQSSHSLDATREFLRGEQFHRRGQFDSASVAYNRAIGYDSTFALAHLMKSMNNAYTYDTDDYAAVVKADANSADLSERDRGMISAFLDQQAGRLASAEQKWTAHLQRYPDEVKALLWLGMLYNRANGRWGKPIEQSRPYFEKVIALEPENVPALHHLARLDAAAGFADSLARRERILDRVAPASEWATDVATMFMYLAHDSTRIATFVKNAANETLIVRIYAVWDAELAASGLVPLDSALLERVVARLRDVDPVARMANKFEPLHDIFTTDVATLERDYTLAALLAMQGRRDEAWAIQRRIAALPPFRAFASLHEDTPKALAARLHYIAGEKKEALALLRTMQFQLPQTANSLAITAGSAALFLRAELELEIGDPAVARGYYAGIVEGFTPADKLYLAVSYERLGQIADRSGRAAEAVSHYERFVHAWAGADPALLPQREAVEARLAVLRRPG